MSMQERNVKIKFIKIQQMRINMCASWTSFTDQKIVFYAMYAYFFDSFYLLCRYCSAHLFYPKSTGNAYNCDLTLQWHFKYYLQYLKKETNGSFFYIFYTSTLVPFRLVSGKLIIAMTIKQQ